MSSSRSKGFVFDTNVLSIFMKDNRVGLLLQTFAYSHKTNQLYVSPAIKHELEVGLQNGVAYLEKALELIEKGDIQIIHPTEEDKLFMDTLPTKLNAGEAEAIAICHRLDLTFISHDRKAINYCERTGIACINFIILLERLRQENLLTESDIEEMLE